MKYLIPTRKYWLWWLLCGAIVLNFAFLNSYPIYILDEAKNAEAAREMLSSGNFLVPFFNGELRTDKPPLHYYFMILGYKLFGVTALGARFFSALMGFLTLGITYLFTQRFESQLAALYTVLVLLASFFFMQEFHLAVPDPYLICFVVLGLFNFYAFYQTRKKKYALWAYISLGLATLAKGPVAIALPGLSIGLFLILKRKSKQAFQYYPILGLIGILAVCTPWFYGVHLATEGAWTQGFFLDHNISRFAETKEGHGGLFLVTWAFVFLGLFPFVVFLPQALRWSLRKSRAPLFQYAGIIGLVFVLFFSISETKLPNYTMPSYPFLALCLGGYFAFGVQNGFQKWDRVSLIVGIVVAQLFPIGGFAALQQDPRFENMVWLSGGLVPLAVGSLIAGVFFWKKNYRKWLIIQAVSGVLTALLLFSWIYPTINLQSPVLAVEQKIPKYANLIVYKSMDAAFPLHFKKVLKISPDMESLIARLEQSSCTYILTNTKQVDSIEQLDGIQLVVEKQALFENHITRLYRLENCPTHLK